MRDSARLLQCNRQQGHILTGVFAVLEGSRMPCATYTEPDFQNAFWEGFTQCDEVTNLFVWNFYGETHFMQLSTFLASGMIPSWQQHQGCISPSLRMKPLLVWLF